ncbi:hypothetical protein O181_103169 [Austropuccinia psidii MF-1]|uniref:Six-hairpin glycosidase n=1 Tax=Austropuccinia psidii MF-1 TaxID=1389203 RepID=A0A9Q3JKN1_9BASI|nr:hypothetical protein [Austropuccinia psidii MF-1]
MRSLIFLFLVFETSLFLRSFASPATDEGSGHSHSLATPKKLHPEKHTKTRRPQEMCAENNTPQKQLGRRGKAMDAFENTAELVYQTLNRVANHSWEWGAQTQVICERYFPSLGVFSTTRQLPLSKVDGPLCPPEKLLDLLDRILANRNTSQLPIIDGDGASGDPASLGVAVMIIAATTSGDISKKYQTLANNQIEWLLNHVPRSLEGALSHRDKEFQYWSDFLYMAPPFIAYYGAWSSNITLLELAYDQARLYRKALQDPHHKIWSWTHIKEGSFEDPGFWSTGNGWAAAGMMRLYATFHNLRDDNLRKKTETWRDDLAHWIAEIIDGAYTYQYADSSLLPNYLASNESKHNYPECAGTAIIVGIRDKKLLVISSFFAQTPSMSMTKDVSDD